jgi:uncharacterized membrane protein YesL
MRDMMEYEKTIYHKLNTIADWFIKVVILNFLMIISSLAIITIYPSLVAGYKMLYGYLHKDEEKIVAGYFSFFIQGLGKKIVIGLILSLILVIGYLNFTQYLELLKAENNILYYMVYYLTIVVLVSVFVVMLYSFSVLYVLPDTKISQIFKVSFYLSGKYFGKTVLLILTTSLPVLMFMFPITQLLFVFFGLSLPLLLNVIITNTVVRHTKEIYSADFKK